MISGPQIRAARALLGISSRELADLALVGWATIRRLELASGVPTARSETLERIQASLEAEGVEFFGDPDASPGVRLHRR